MLSLIYWVSWSLCCKCYKNRDCLSIFQFESYFDAKMLVIRQFLTTDLKILNTGPAYVIIILLLNLALLNSCLNRSTPDVKILNSRPFDFKSFLTLLRF